MLSGSKIAPQRQRLFIPWFEMSGFVDAAAMASAGAGAPVPKAVNSLGLTGLFMDEAGDDVYHYMPIPTDWDRSKDIRFRAHFVTGSAEVLDTTTWKILYLPIQVGTTVIIAPATALNTAIVQATVAGTAWTSEQSPWGILNGKTLTDDHDAIAFITELQAFAAGLAEDVLFFGTEIEYTMKLGKGHRSFEAASPVV